MARNRVAATPPATPRASNAPAAPHRIRRATRPCPPTPPTTAPAPAVSADTAKQAAGPGITSPPVTARASSGFDPAGQVTPAAHKA